MDPKLLMSWEELNRLGKTPKPYLFTIQGQGQVLVYFGAEHSQDPAHPQFEQLLSEWKKFISRTMPEQRVAFVEGDVRPLAANGEQAIVRSGGEGGLLTYLAHRDGCEVICPEPKRGPMLNDLAKRYTRDQVIYYEVAATIPSYFKKKDPGSIDVWLGHFLERSKTATGWEDFDFSLTHFKDLHRQFFGKEFDPTDGNNFYDIIAPTEFYGFTNEISRDEDLVRDSTIVDGIKEQWDKGKSCFVVYGASHAVRQKSALEALLTF